MTSDDTRNSAEASVPGDPRSESTQLAPAESREAGIICPNCGGTDTRPLDEDVLERAINQGSQVGLLLAHDVAVMFKHARICRACKHVTLGNLDRPNLSQLRKA